MLTEFFNGFVKVTGFPAYLAAFRTKVYYEDKRVQSRRIRGAALLISNHTSVFDYAVLLFVFFTRTLRVQMAEVLYQNKLLGLFLKMMGGIYVDREARNFGYLALSEEHLRKGRVVGVFPEGRLPKKGEQPPLPFKPGAAYLALAANVPVIPVFTNGSYFRFKQRARVIIGKPMYPGDYSDSQSDDKENIRRLTEAMRQRMTELERLLDEQTK